jgi:hypothetical protein
VKHRTAFVISLIVGFAAGIVAYTMPHSIRLNGVGIGDIGLPLVGMEQFLAGRSPYTVHLRAMPAALYPFTTMMLLAPFLLVPFQFVAAVFCGVSSSVLAYAILREGPLWRLLIFASPCYVSALHSVQWSPLLVAALLLPQLLPIAMVKPQLGIVLAIAGRWSRLTVAIVGAIIVLSLIIYPRWPLEWWHHGSLETFDGRSPLLVVPGFLLAASLLLVRTEGGRLLIGMAVTVQRYFYDQLPLFLLPSSALQMIALVASSWAVVLLSVALKWWKPLSGVQDMRTWIALVIGVFLPAMAMTFYNEVWRRRAGARANKGPQQ